MPDLALRMGVLDLLSRFMMCMPAATKRDGMGKKLFFELHECVVKAASACSLCESFICMGDTLETCTAYTHTHTHTHTALQLRLKQIAQVELCTHRWCFAADAESYPA